MYKKNNISGLLLTVCLALMLSCAGKKSGSSASSQTAEGKDKQAMKGENIGQEQGSGSEAGGVGGRGAGADVMIERIYFDFDDANLRQDARETLKKDAETLNQNPNLKISVEGHCDDRGSAEYNLALGQKRAENIMKYLSNLGISGKRISIISYGKEKPLVMGNSEEAWSKNRRGELTPVK